MKRLITVFALITLAITTLFPGNQALLLAKSSTTASERMTTANQFYKTGQFLLAAQSYQQLVDQGYVDSTLHYNLGNAWFKAGDFGRAIFNYRLAGQLAPRDIDIKTNLNLARMQVIDQLPETETFTKEGFIDQFGHFTQNRLTLNELAVAALATWILFILLLIAFTSSKKGGTLREGLQYALMVSALTLIIGVSGLGSRLYVENSRLAAVVLNTEIAVTSGPGAQYVTEFTLHNGTEVDVLESRDNWVRLALPHTQLQGWVPTGAIALIGS